MNRHLKMFSLLFAFFAVSVLPTLGNANAHRIRHNDNADIPKNIILFIGDGMGVSHVTASRVTVEQLNMARFKTMGLLSTHSLNAFVTDSAAAGTALATGNKTYNGAISVLPDGTSLKTAIEYAEEHDKLTGIAVACSVTHATPAAFTAHASSRNEQCLIAEQITASGIDVILGGGLAYFTPQSMEGSVRKDDKNLISELNKRMKVIQSAEEFYQLENVNCLAGFFAADQPAKAGERKPDLTELTRKAIEILSKSKNGFFLMVEGSQIDWEAHANSQDTLIKELEDFDKAIGAGLDFAQDNTCTLVIVTADHETGGFAVHDGSVAEHKVSASGWTSKGHTAGMVPIFAYGPGGSAFAGIQDNTIVGKTIIKYLQSK